MEIVRITTKLFKLTEKQVKQLKEAVNLVINSQYPRYWLKQFFFKSSWQGRYHPLN